MPRFFRLSNHITIVARGVRSFFWWQSSWRIIMQAAQQNELEAMTDMFNK